MKEFTNPNTNEKYTWDEMVYEFTTEVTHGDLTDKEISEMDDAQFVAAVEKYTNFQLA